MTASEDVVSLIEDYPELVELVEMVRKERKRMELHHTIEKVGVHTNEKLLDENKSAKSLDARTLGWIAVLHYAVHGDESDSAAKHLEHIGDP